MIGLLLSVLSMSAAASEAQQAAPVFTPQISWSVEPGLTCPTRRLLENAYHRQTAAATTEGAPVLAVLVEVGRVSTDESLVVRLSIPAFHQSEYRDIDVRGSNCREVVQTIVILAGAWVGNLQHLQNSATVATGTAQKPPSPDDAYGFPLANSPTLPTVIHLEGAEGSSHDRLGLTLGLGAALWLASGGAAASIMLNAELRVSKTLAVGLLAAWIGDLSATDPPYGSVVVQRQLFGVSAGLAIPGVNRLGIQGLGADLVGALVVWHGNAQSLAYPVTVQSDLLDPGVMAGARLRQRIGDLLFLQAEIAAIVLSHSYNLEVQRLINETVLVASVPAFALELGLGVGVQIF